MRKVLALLLACLLLYACAAASEMDSSLFRVVDSPMATDDILASMTLHEKVCQLFFVTPESFSNQGRVNEASRDFFRAFSRFPVGGVILFAENILKSKIKDLNAGMQEAAAGVNGIGLLIGADEEGGRISRVANKLNLREKQPGPTKITSAEQAYDSGRIIGKYLSEYGFNVNFAPVADVRSEETGSEVYRRTYSTDPEIVSEYVARFVDGLHESSIISVLKHFPGHGAVSGNTHNGPGVSRKTLEELRAVDFLPFIAGIQADAEIVLLSHQLTANIDPETPASMSETVISLLRDELGFRGVVITDALRMGAIRNGYGSGESCVRALEAGADMLLLPYNFTNAYNGVMEALESGRLTEARIDESVRRILLLKEKYNLLSPAGM